MSERLEKIRIRYLDWYQGVGSVIARWKDIGELLTLLTEETARADAEMESNHRLIARNLELEAQLERMRQGEHAADQRITELEVQLTAANARADALSRSRDLCHHYAGCDQVNCKLDGDDCPASRAPEQTT